MFQITVTDDYSGNPEIVYNFTDEDVLGMDFKDFADLLQLYFAIRAKYDAVPSEKTAICGYRPVLRKIEAVDSDDVK